MATLVAGSPEWWLDLLHRTLVGRRSTLVALQDYYDGKHPLLFATQKFRQAFGRQFGAFSDNWCPIVCDAIVERLQVTGFRLGPDAAADTKLWDIWQANQLDADSELAISDAVTLGDSSMLVWPEPDSAVPRITVESPFQMIVAFAKGDRRRRAAALKVWVEDDGFAYATLYLPDFLYKYRSKTKADDAGGDGGAHLWQQREITSEKWPLPNPLGVVPVVPLINNPTLLEWTGRSELVPVIPVQDAVNKLCADMIVASEYGSFRQRWATGVDIPVDPATNQPVDDFKTALGKVWRTPNPDARFGDFEQTDLGQFVTAIEMFVQHIASQTRTPPHYFNSFGGQFPSGEALRSAETGLVAKAKRKHRHFGESFEEVMKLALVASGDRRRRKVDSMETLWRDPETRVESEHVDAVIKHKTVNVPDEVLWERLGYSPQEIERIKALIATEVQAPPTSTPDGVPTPDEMREAMGVATQQ